MSSGVTCIAWAIAGTAVLRMVVSSDCMKNATATSQGSRRLVRSVGGGDCSAVVKTRRGSALRDGVARDWPRHPVLAVEADDFGLVRHVALAVRPVGRHHA